MALIGGGLCLAPSPSEGRIVSVASGTTISVSDGKSADVIAVEGNPLADPHAFRRVRLVMKEGRIIRIE